MLTKKKYLILDIDGTLCDSPIHLSIPDFHKVNHLGLLPMKQVIDKIYCKYPAHSFEFLFVTARCQSLYFPTRDWIKKECRDFMEDVPVQLFMRPLDCLSESWFLKINLLEKMGIRPNQVEIWLEDDILTINNAKREGFNIHHPNAFLRGEG